VLKGLAKITPEDAASIFSVAALSHVTDIYTNFKDGSSRKMEAIAMSYPNLTEQLGEDFASRGVTKVEERVLGELFERRFITPKLFVSIKEKFHVDG
jgi:hypothetical protein